MSTRLVRDLQSEGLTVITDQRMLNLAKLMDVASLRSRVHAANIANQSTPGYRARAVAFEAAFNETQRVHGDAAARKVDATVYQPRDTAVDNDGNDVSVDREVNTLAQNALLYQTYITLMRGKSTLLQTAMRGAEG